MNAVALGNLIGREIDLAFDLAGELVRACVFDKTLTGPGTGLLDVSTLEAPVNVLFVDYHSQDIDGSAVLLGDEKAYVRSSDLAGIVAPAAGDVITENLSGLRRVVVAARCSPTGVYWTLQVRRSNSADFGDLTLADSADERGDLTAATMFDDWQS
ncbi:MAG: hypothetical protein ABSC03_10395 [Verrucomicrobiota bacterium]|jgi:hypothetical protein